MRRAVAAVLLTSFVGASQAGAQEDTSLPKLLLINALIGSSTAAITAAIHHRAVGTAALNGSIGGLTVFAGKCVLARGGSAREWIAQWTVAIGSSMIANSATGRTPFERFVVPVGPIRLYRDNKRGKVNVKLDLFQSGVAAYFATRPGNTFEWNQSLKHAALIVDDPDADNDLEIGGVIKTWHPDRFFSRHELIHVAQEQFVTTALEEPLEGWLLPKIPGGRTVNRYFEIGLLAPVWAAANSMISRFDRPWESEAEALSERCGTRKTAP